MKRIELKVPKLEEMHYRQKWMQDPNTMNYNAGFEMNLLGYDYQTGTMSKTDEEMKVWYNNWIGQEPNKYFAYIYETNKNVPIGEVYFYKDKDKYKMGILIVNEFRGKKFSKDALNKLMKISFEKYGIPELTDSFPDDRISAIKLFKSYGFKESGNIEEIIRFGKKDISREMIITKDIYFKEDH